MNEKHSYKLLRPVKFKDVQVGDVLVLKDSSPVSKSSVAHGEAFRALSKKKD